MIETEINQLRERCAKMAAARQEFQVIWQTNIQQDLTGLRLSEILRIEQLCWTTFLCSKGLK
jgi:hypothetical protein